VTLTPGASFGAFEILSPIGAGGMGEVYRARDTRLGREVAIKVLPDLFARDPDRLSRFDREARLLASLNHPHIAQIYGLEEQGPTKALVMEFVDGPTLADRIDAGPVPLGGAVRIAQQIAEALEAAHTRGIIHRDLKPANVKLSTDGRVKVLDFGLAKLTRSDGGSGVEKNTMLSGAMSPTITSPMVTGGGVILGSAAYMSPEQARGQTLDERTDIWAFGCVLFEMLTRQSTFAAAGGSISDAIAAVLTRDPDWALLPPETPAAVRRLLRRCLTKDPTKRLQHIGDARLELEDLVADPAGDALPRAATRPGARIAYLPWLLTAAACALAIVAGWRAWFAAAATSGISSPTARLELNLPAGVELFSGPARTGAVTPDGKSVTFVGVSTGSRMVYLRRLDQFDAVPIRGTETAVTSFFAPDGRTLGFVTSAGELRTMSLADGLVTTIATGVSVFYGAAWGPDDRVLFVRDGAIWSVGRSGSDARALTTLKAGEETVHAWPIALPDRKTVLFSVQTRDRWQIEALALATGNRQVVLTDATMPQLGPDDYLFFYRDGRLLAVPFEFSGLRPTGPAIQPVEDLPSSLNVAPANVSSTGIIVYAPDAANRQLVWVSRLGGEEMITDTARGYTSPRLSPDGTRIVVQAGGIWVLDLRRHSLELVATLNAEGNTFPAWLPDGHSVIHRSGLGLRVQPTDGGGGGRTLPGTTEFDYPAGMTADGQSLLFNRIGPATSFDVFVAPLNDLTRATPVVRTAAYEAGARLSPDEKWIVYVSNVSGRNEIYAHSFRGPERRRQVSTEGGTQPVWNPNGREIFYRIGNKMMAVSVTPSATDITLSPPRLLFEGPYGYGAGITLANYDVTPDGQRFLMVREDTAASRLRMMLNWSPAAVRNVSPASP